MRSIFFFFFFIALMNPLSAQKNQNDCFPADELTRLRSIIEKAIQYAEIDNSANGKSGAYASAARDNLKFLKQALDETIHLIKFNQTGGDGNPATISFNDAGTVENNLISIINKLTNATHWASISAIYHRSTNARNSYREGSKAMILAANLKSQAGDCFIRLYLR